MGEECNNRTNNVCKHWKIMEHLHWVGITEIAFCFGCDALTLSKSKQGVFNVQGA